MIKEKYTVINKELCLTVTANKITSVRFNDKTCVGYRVYDGKYIGIAGAVGSHEPEKLWKDASAALDNKIEYPYAVRENYDHHREQTRCRISEKEFIEKTETLLSGLEKRFPSFVFSNKCYLSDNLSALENDSGTKLSYKSSFVQIALVINKRGSGNIFDTGYFGLPEVYDVDAIIDDMAILLDKFDKKVDIEEGYYPVIVGFSETFGDVFARHLNPDLFSRGASLLSGRLNDKVFNEAFTLGVSRTGDVYPTVFFDNEGTTLEKNKISLIEKGVLKSPYASKREAQLYGYPLTASAGGNYDSVPQAVPTEIVPFPTGKLNELIKGRCVYVDVTSGGDFTATGDFAFPVQSAYLVEDGAVVGKLPQININGNVFNAFGEGYIGTAIGGLYKHSADTPLVVKAKVTK